MTQDGRPKRLARGGGGMRRICLTVCAAVLAGRCVPAAAEESVAPGPETLLLSGGPGEGVQATPAVAFGKDGYLAVWREGWHGKNGRARIFAARVATDGQVLDARGTEIAPCREGVQERPRVAFSGGLFVVVWQDLRNGKDYDVLAARVSGEGKVLDAQPIVVAGGPDNQALPDVAGDGRNFLAVWQGAVEEKVRTSPPPRKPGEASQPQGQEFGVLVYKGFAAPLGADGKVGAAVESGATPQPRIAWNGQCYLAAWGGTEIFSARLDAGGRQIAPSKWGTLTLRGTKAAAFSLSAAGQGWLVVAHRSPPDPWGWGGPGAMRCSQIRPDGTLENADALREQAGVQGRLPNWLDHGREKKAGATWPWGASASAWTGTCSLVVWQRQHLTGELFTRFGNSDLIAARVDGFRSLDPAGIPLADSGDDEINPALAGDGRGGLLCVYEKRAADGKSQVAARVVRVRPSLGAGQQPALPQR